MQELSRVYGTYLLAVRCRILFLLASLAAVCEILLLFNGPRGNIGLLQPHPYCVAPLAQQPLRNTKWLGFPDRISGNTWIGFSREDIHRCRRPPPTDRASSSMVRREYTTLAPASGAWVSSSPQCKPEAWKDTSIPKSAP